jgi:predicted nucleic acid-binding Zn ribbon protein
MSTRTEIDPEQPQPLAVEQAILELLHSCGAGPGDQVDIFVAQHTIERKGIDRKQFSAGVAQLLSRGAISMKGNAFFLTDAGFESLKRDEGGGHV